MFESVPVVTWSRRSRHRLLVGALAAAVVAPVVLLASGSGAHAANLPPYQVTLPDLQIEVPTSLISVGTNPDTGDTQLQFTHITWDAGTGPFVIDAPHYNKKTGMGSFVQRIYASRGNGSWRKAYTVPLAAVGIFQPPSDYQLPLTRFTLDEVNPDGSPGTVVATSPKQDYCITADTYVGGVPNTPNQTYPPQSDCTGPRKPLGLAVGWGDQYDQTDNGQPIDLTGVADGTYILHAEVDPDHLFVESDATNDVTNTLLTINVAQQTVTVLSQTGPPQSVPAVTMATPAAGARLHGTVTLLASVRPASSPVTSVQYLVDGEPVGPPVRSAPFSLRWPTEDVLPGRHEVSARVTDAAGVVATAPVRSIDVTGTGASSGTPATATPTILLANPTPGETESGTVPVAAVVRDSSAVRSVQFALDGRPLGRPVSSAPFAVQWPTTTTTGGRHTLSAEALDEAGNVFDSQAVPVVVTNPAPPMTCFVLQATVHARGTGRSTAPPLHTASAGETVLAFVSTTGNVHRVRVEGGGLGWKLVRSAGEARGGVEVWAATAHDVRGGIRITATTGGSRAQVDLTVMTMEGVRGIGASSAASGAAGAPHASLRTTDATSLVFAAGTLSGAQPALPRGWVALRTSSSGGERSWSQYTNWPAGPKGTLVSLHDGGGPGGPWSVVAVELLRDPGA